MLFGKGLRVIKNLDSLVNSYGFFSRFRLIIGFMDKNESQDKLLSKPNGTFLLRFSDGTVGGITIAWVADHPEKIGKLQDFYNCNFLYFCI